MDALSLARDLIAYDSVSRRSNADISDHVERTLRSLGFETERVPYDDPAGVPKVNVLGRLGPAPRSPGTGPAGLAYFCHTDVVPAGDWDAPGGGGPFDPHVADGRLYGRGACDMKGSLAAMLAAAAGVRPGELTAPLYVVCTADEETGFHGARQVAQHSELYRELRSAGPAGIIGEPTGLRVVHAHKGSVALRFTSRGEAAHSSTAAGRNANLAMIPFLTAIKTLHDETEADSRWHDGRFDPPTMSWNIGVCDHNPAINIKAARSVCTVYFRPMPDQDVTPLIDRARAAAASHGLESELFFESAPFLTPPDAPVVQDWLTLTGTERAETVCFGTDAGVFREVGRLVVCGPGDIAQAHTRDEWIALNQLTRGTALNTRAIHHFCAS